MKKTLFVVALATICVLAFAGSAFAVNMSGQQRLGAAATANASSPDSATIVGGGTYTYQDWKVSQNAAGNVGNVQAGVPDNSPHGDFTTLTVKCVVCHAVHYAAPGGAPVGLGQTADTLLRMKASDACIYCHATTGMAVNGKPVYDGLGGAITAPGATGGETTTGHYIGTNCNCCHSSVHGANADKSVASLRGYLLLKLPSAVGVVPTANMLDAITAIDHNAENQGFTAGTALAGTIGTYAGTNSTTMREQAVGIFCAECHNGAYATGAAGATTNVRGSNTPVAFSGHRIAAAATVNWNADSSKSSGSFAGQTAWAPATNCKSCHDADDTWGNVAFPHSWGGSKMWLMKAPDAGTTKTDSLAIGAGSNNPASTTGLAQLRDGVCLKCHVASGGTAGVGLTY